MELTSSYSNDLRLAVGDCVNGGMMTAEMLQRNSIEVKSDAGRRKLHSTKHKQKKVEPAADARHL